MEFVYIEDLVPEDHILRKIDKYIDFSFINDICRTYYCENNSRPEIEVGLGAGYNTSAICKTLFEYFKVKVAMGKRRGCQQKGKYGEYRFRYIPEWKVYICPEINYLEIGNYHFYAVI